MVFKVLDKAAVFGDEVKLGQFYSLLQEAFPEEERPPLASLKARFADPLFRIQAYYQQEDSLFALLTWWELAGHCYIEHFALSAHSRGKGIGSQLLFSFMSGLEMPVVLEVEPPLTELAARRIRFYESSGLSVLPVVYRQPAYRQGGKQPEMLLMSACPEVTLRDLDLLTAMMRKRVYGTTV